MAAAQHARSLLPPFVLPNLILVADDVGAAVLVDLYLTGRLPLLHPIDRVLSVADLLLPSHELLLQLLDLAVLLLDFGGQTFAVDCSGLLKAKLLFLVDLRPAALGAGLEQVDGAPVGSYKTK